jgi:hypothetical protein
MTDMNIIAADLQQKIGAAQAAIAGIDAKRKTVAFDAETGDDGARKAMAKLHADRNARLAEVDDLNAALDEAKRRSAAAAAAAAEEGLKARAERAKPIAERLAERGKKLDAAIQAYVAEFAAIGDDLDQLARLGVPIPSRDLVRVNLRRAHDSATAPLDKTSRPVSPTMRRSFDSLLAGWTQPAKNWIATKLNTAAKAAETREFQR